MRSGTPALRTSRMLLQPRVDPFGFQTNGSSSTHARVTQLTHDLDFSAILAATSEAAPSVVQLRVQDLLSERALGAIVTALNAHAKDIGVGALMSIDESGGRVRILPLRQP